MQTEPGLVKTLDVLAPAEVTLAPAAASGVAAPDCNHVPHLYGCFGSAHGITVLMISTSWITTDASQGDFLLLSLYSLTLLSHFTFSLSLSLSC